MITENRVSDGSFPIPNLMIDKEDINRFIEEFKGFHAQFADCFFVRNHGITFISTWQAR